MVKVPPMSRDAHEGLVGTLRHHIQITLLGALIVLAPLVLLVHTVLRVRTAVDKAVAPLRELLPGAKISVAGVSGIELATLLLALFVCWLLGWGIVRRLYRIHVAQIRPLACSLDDFRKTLTAAGRGSQDWLRTLAESTKL